MIIKDNLSTLASTNKLAEIADYVFQDYFHNRLTPRIIDIAYTAFMSGRSGKNKEDGGPCDWFNDTRPTVDECIKKVRAELSQAAEHANPQAVANTTTENQMRALLIEIDAHARKAWADGTLSAAAWPADLAQRVAQAAGKAIPHRTTPT